MKLSTLIANIILKILEAFGIKPVQDKRKIMQDKQAQDAFANALKRNPKLGQMLADSDLSPGTPLPKADPAGSSDCAPGCTTCTQVSTVAGALSNEPLKPLSDMGIPISAEAQNEGPPILTDYIKSERAKLDPSEVGVTPIERPFLPPEATDPTDAPDWIDAKYGDDWKTHVNK